MLASCLFALWNGPIHTWGIGDMAIAIILIAGVVAIIWIVLTALEITPPPWAIKLFWVVVICALAIFCVRLLMSM